MKEPRCSEHEDERLNIYCVSCQTPTCSMCKVFGQHKDCQVSPLLAVYQSRKAELLAAVELLAAADAGVQAAVARLDDACRLVADNAERQRRRLGESLDLLFAVLEQRKAELLQRVDAEQSRRAAALRELAERLRQRLRDGVALRDKLQQSVQADGPAHFLLTAKTLQREAAAATETPLERPEPGYESLEHLSVDTEEVETLLARMDFSQDGDDEDTQ